MRSALTLLLLWACGDDLPDVPAVDAGPVGTDTSVEGCAPPSMVCGSRCVNPATDPRNCGECGNECDPGTFCSGGRCSSSCASERLECGSSCVDIASDPMHCGRCDNACTGGQACVGGSCRCPDQTRMCGDECVDTSGSSAHCGDCGNACEDQEICRSGDCIRVRESDCDNGIDEDLDDARDCADADCTGFERDCACEVMGMSGTEVCGMDGMFSDCTGCPAPQCSAAMPCETYGYECGMLSTCELNEEALYDLVLTRIALPPAQPDGMGGTRDWEGFLGGTPDVYVWVEVGTEVINFEVFGDWLAARQCVPPEMQPTRTPGNLNPNADYVIELMDDRAVLVRGRTVREYMDYLRIWVWDDDGLTGDGEGPCNSELMNFCTFPLEERHFGTGSRQWTCPETGTRGAITFTLALREPR